MSPSAGLKLCHMCGYVGLKGAGSGKEGGQGLVENGAVNFQMGPEWGEVHT